MKHDRIQSLDDYYLSLPDTRPRFRWPVFDDPFFGTKPLTWCDDYWQAVEMVNSDKRDLYIGEPQEWERVEA